jgi:predicted ABC-type ATPase
MRSNAPPTVYVLAGPNGAGKTTFAQEFLPDFVHCREFVNADMIAAGLSPFAPETQDFRAARLMLSRIKELAAAQASFAFETTLAGRCHVHHLKRMREVGYQVVLFFLWLSSVEMAVRRVRARFQQGGHNVPEHIIRRRYTAGLNNLFSLYLPVVDVWRLYDASNLPPSVVAHMEGGSATVYDEKKYEIILQGKMERS